MNISVLGLGYVGCVSAACLAQKGHHVVGVDVNARKVEIINQGGSPIVEAGLDDIIREQAAAGRLSASMDTAAAVRGAELVLICVGTPSNGNGSIDLHYIQRVCQDIGKALREKEEYTVVALRSTVLPGVAEEVAKPILEQASGKQVGSGFGFALNPEFLREGSSVHDFYHPPKTIIGAFDERSARLLAELYAELPAPIFQLAPREAAMIKYSDNAFHALKVAFANEIGRLCKAMQVDSRTVMDVFVQDTKLNLSPYYLKPGFAFGGSCLPKDLRAITHRAQQMDVTVPLLRAAIESNEEHIHYALEMVKRNGRQRIGVLGLSFKPDTDDLRESPVVSLIEQLIGKGYEVQIYDKNVFLGNLMGANKEFIEREVPHIAKLMCSSIREVLDKTDVVVIGNNAKEYETILTEHRNGHRIIDLSGVGEEQNSYTKEANYEGICW
jgi:GDP-mannose 6-dehydrogenase